MASKLLDKLIEEFETQEKDPNYVRPIKVYSDEWYFGQMIGNIIVNKFLLSLNVDLMYRKVVKVSEEEFNEAERLNEQIVSRDWDKTHKIWLDYINSLAIKYLPETIQCTFDLPEFTVTEDIQKGIENFIWNCDFSRYWIDNLLGQTINKNNPIILKLQVKNNYV